MPIETARKRANKTISIPGGTSVKIPVITEITFIDPANRFQETVFTINNSKSADRKVHVETIQSSSGGDSQIDVERIDMWRDRDIPNRVQDTDTTVDNATGENDQPPHFKTHLKTHVNRCYADPSNKDDNGSWVDTEVIDEFVVSDPADRGQETHYYLTNPQPDDPLAQAQDGDPDITDASPYRTDPFQNIVNWHSDDSGSSGGFNCPSTIFCTVRIGVIYGSLVIPYNSNGNTAYYTDPHTAGSIELPGTMNGSVVGPGGDSFYRWPDFLHFIIEPPSGGTVVTWQVTNEENGKTKGPFTSDFSGLSFQNNSCGLYTPTSIEWGPLTDDGVFSFFGMYYAGSLSFSR